MPHVDPYALEHYGVVWTDRRRYAPLDVAELTFVCGREPDTTFVFVVHDGAGRPYHRAEVTAVDGAATLSLRVGGVPGLQIVRVYRAGEDEGGFCPFRMGSFVLAAETGARAAGTDVAEFFTWLREALAGSLDRARYQGRWVAGDKAADNSPMNLAYPRFRLNTTVYLEDADTLQGHLDLIYAHQQPDGSLFDHLYGDGHPGWGGERRIRSMMADLETGSIINVHQVWMATGDTEWMRGLMEPMLRGWHYATSSPDLWCAEHGLIKRPHTADEWDCQLGDGSCFRNEQSRYAIACCDAVRLPKAADRLADMLAALDRTDEAAELRAFAAGARGRANALLWDGTKYRHHHHLDPMDHDTFDEDAQLVMSNTWACTDGLADHAQAVAIIEEYHRRLAATGDRYAWWSLQPGYPEGSFPSYPPGVYLNGGLFPWVGGELCRACFGHGFAARGWHLWQEFWARVKADHGACPTWYTLDGQAAANTFWTTNYDAWGIAAWGQAVIEGLVGVVPLAPAMARCACAPQWQVGGVTEAETCVALPASQGYLAYHYAAGNGGLSLCFTGSGDAVEWAIPVAAAPAATRATLDGAPVAMARAEHHGVDRWCLTVALDGVHELRLMP